MKTNVCINCNTTILLDERGIWWHDRGEYHDATIECPNTPKRCTWIVPDHIAIPQKETPLS